MAEGGAYGLCGGDVAGAAGEGPESAAAVTALGVYGDGAAPGCGGAGVIASWVVVTGAWKGI